MGLHVAINELQNREGEDAKRSSLMSALDRLDNSSMEVTHNPNKLRDLRGESSPSEERS